MSATVAENKIHLSTTEKTMISGGIAGSVGKTITAPLSRLTILYQVSPILSCPEGKSALSINTSDSLWKTTRNILRTEGVLAFWKGNFTSVIHRFPYSAVNFYSYEVARAFMHRTFNSKDTTGVRFACGGFSGMMACFACYPLELIRTRMTVVDSFSTTKEAIAIAGPATNNGAPRMFQSKMYKIVRDIVAQDGIFGLYRGLSVSLCVAMPTLAIGFSVYGQMKKTLLNKGGIFKNDKSGHLSVYGALLSGCVSGVSSSVIMFPTDVLRKRLQVMNDKLTPAITKSIQSSVEVTNSSNSFITTNTSGNNLNIRYSNTTTINASVPLRGNSARFVIFNHYKNILATEGVRGMYRGLLPELMKVCPMVAITFCVYEMSSDFLNEKFPTSSVLQE